MDVAVATTPVQLASTKQVRFTERKTKAVALAVCVMLQQDASVELGTPAG